MNNADDRPTVGRDWIAFVVAWIPYSLLTYRFWHNIDDAFISFRYAKNWAMGYGPRYNLGPQQPEEGYSNFLWVVVCTFIEYRCLRCLLLVMCTHPYAKKALTLHLARSEGRERYFGCNLMHRRVLASSHQHLMAEAPHRTPTRTSRHLS